MIETGNQAWYNDNGNNTHAINYPLDENSIVVDLGGYHGIWASQIVAKYNPYIYLLEPVPTYCNTLADRFRNNPKVTVLNYGVGTQARKDVLYLNEDGTSKYYNTQLTPVEVELISMQQLLTLVGKRVDLMQINIEGEEYGLLEKAIVDGTINQIKHLQIQFHTYIDNAVERRNNIQEGLSKSFTKTFDYPFVFEGWKNNY